MDTDTIIPKAIWGFNGTERPGAVYLAAALAGYTQKGLTAFTMDLYKPFINRATSDHQMILVGGISSIAIVILSVLVAVNLGNLHQMLLSFFLISSTIITLSLLGKKEPPRGITLYKGILTGWKFNIMSFTLVLILTSIFIIF